MKTKYDFIKDVLKIDPDARAMDAAEMFYHYWERSIKCLKNGKRNTHSNQSCQKVAI